MPKFLSTSLFIVIFLFTGYITVSKLYAQTVRDSDFDGIFDEVENNTYMTDPSKPDTDNDGILDFQEIKDGTDPLDANSSAVKKYVLKDSILLTSGDPIMWYIGRIAGISAFIMFTFVVSMGLLMTSKFLLKFRIFSAPGALETHSFTATYIAFALLLIHIVSLMFDDFVRLSIYEILIPFQVERSFQSVLGFDLKIPISLGIIALYLSLTLIITSHLRNKVIPQKIWRTIHYSSFMFYLFFLIHAYTTGSDSKEPWMVTIYIISASTVLGLILLRIFGKKYFLASVSKRKTPAAVQEQAVQITTLQ